MQDEGRVTPGGAGQGMLHIGFVLWHLPVSSGQGGGLGGKGFICIPIYYLWGKMDNEHPWQG